MLGIFIAREFFMALPAGRASPDISSLGMIIEVANMLVRYWNMAFKKTPGQAGHFLN